MLRNSPSTIDIRPAVSDDDRRAVYALRYAVIVDELHVPIGAADHQNRLVIDREDETGHCLAAFRGQTVVGALRVNFLRDGDVEPHRAIFGFDRLSRAERATASASTRFFVTAAARGSHVGIRITQAWYRFCRTHGIERDYILVKDQLADFYRRLGWIVMSDRVHHPEVGTVVPMLLHLCDEEHLRAIRSPFVACLHDGVCA